jgi:putative MATE family efflux protein
VNASEGLVARPPDQDSAAALPFEPVRTASGVALPESEGEAILVSRPLRETIARLAIPAVASTLLMTTFTSVDAFWIGRVIGPAGLAAVTASLFWIWTLISVSEMIAVGFTAIAARRHGERRGSEASRVAGEAVTYAFLLGGAFSALGLLLAEDLFNVIGVNSEVRALALPYFRTYLVGAPLIFGFFAVDAAFRSGGDSRTPFLLLAASVAVTLALDPILIMGLGPAPQLGMNGAAISMVSTRGIVCLVGLAVLRRRGLLQFQRPRFHSVAQITRIGLPLAFWGVTFSLIYVALGRIAAPFGTSALAALGIGHRIESWLYMTCVGIGAAAAAIVGQNLGAGHPERAYRAGWHSAGYTVVLGLVLSVISLTMAEDLVSVFTSDAYVVTEGARYLRIAVISNVLLGTEIVLEAAMGGAGYTLPPMLTSTALTAARIPLAVWLTGRVGVSGIWWSIALTAALRAVAMIALWRAGHWKRRIV